MSTENQNIAILSDLQKIQFELVAPKNKFNAFGKYNYRSCEDILEALKPLLKKYSCSLYLTDESKELCGIPIVISTVHFVDSQGKETIVKAEAGVELNKKGMDVAQAFGTSSSYARKYALNGLFLIDDNKDPDTDEFCQQSDAMQKQQANQLANECKQALQDIAQATDKQVLVKAWNYFKSTQYAKEIQNAAKAKKDKEGWK